MKNSPNPSSAKLPPFLTLSLLANACLLVAISTVPAAGQAPAQTPAAAPAPALTPAQAQDKTPANPPAPAQPAATAAQPPAGTPAEAHAETHVAQAETHKAETHKDQIAADSAKLFQLANELKAEMDKSTKDTLSLSVMKKAEEVEKLAHKVRDEMRASLSN
jgi:hypothetical protein